MKKRNFKYLTVIILLFPLYSFSQSIKGVIKDSLGTPIKSANILLQSKEKKIIQFISSDNNGEYNFQNIKNYKEVVLSVRTLGYKTYSKKFILNDNIIIHDIILKSNNTKLDEIILKEKKIPITINGDTTKYNVSSFLDGSERKVEELIKKLPGVDVDEESGEIKFKDKSIETILLEGDDLFGSDYTLGSKNMNVDIVESVEAYENYSENKLLKGIENAENKVALNLKLKKNIIDLSGGINVLGGIDENKKILYNTGGNILGITKNYKSFGILSYNNVGKNRSTFDYFGGRRNIDQIKEGTFKTNKIIRESTFTNGLKDSRVNLNNQLFVNYNNVFNPTKNISTKVNFYYLNDVIMNERFNQTDYIINGNTLQTTDSYITKKKPEKYRADVNIDYDINEKTKLEYDLRWIYENIDTKSNTEQNKTLSLKTNLNSKEYYLRQKLLLTHKVSNNKVLQFNINYSDNKMPQVYEINPSIFNKGDNFSDIQKTEFRKTYADFLASLIGDYKGDKYEFRIGNTNNYEPYSSNLYNDNTEIANYKNDFDYSLNDIYSTGIYNYKIKDFTIIPSYQAVFFKQKLNDMVKEDFIYDLSLSLQYKYNDKQTLIAMGRYGQSMISPTNLFEGNVLISNRTSISNNPTLDIRNSINSSLVYNYNDLFEKQLSFKALVGYSKNEGNFFSNNIVNENNTEIINFFLPNESNDNINTSISFSKYLDFIESTIKVSSSYQVSKYKNIINNSDLRDNRGDFVFGSLTYRSSFDIFINFQNNFSFSNMKNETNNINIENTSLRNYFKIILKPNKEFLITLLSDYYLPNIDDSQKYNFFDISARYRPKKKRYEISFTAKNILNENQFIRISTSDYFTAINRINLFPRYFTLSFRYDF